MFHRIMADCIVGGIVLGCSANLHEVENTVTPIRNILVDDDAWNFNWASFDQDKIVSWAGYQYTVYWAADRVLTVARRCRESDQVQRVRMESYQLAAGLTPKQQNNGHCNTVLGISPGDGRLHLSWDHHASELNYTRSRVGWIVDPPATIDIADFEPRQLLGPDAPQRVTYPRFLNDGDGRLFFMYRAGGSGSGQTVFSRYDSGHGKWHVSSGLLFGSTGTYPPWNNSRSRNAYLHDVLFDKHNRLHVTWVYRETSASWASNHDLHYAYSDDSGITWMNNNGDKIADLSRNKAIEITDPGIVIEKIPVYSWLMNQCAMALDSSNQPHVALYKLPNTFKPENLQHTPPAEVQTALPSL